MPAHSARLLDVGRRPLGLHTTSCNEAQIPHCHWRPVWNACQRVARHRPVSISGAPATKSVGTLSVTSLLLNTLLTASASAGVNRRLPTMGVFTCTQPRQGSSINTFGQQPLNLLLSTFQGPCVPVGQRKPPVQEVAQLATHLHQLRQVGRSLKGLLQQCCMLFQAKVHRVDVEVKGDSQWAGSCGTGAACCCCCCDCCCGSCCCRLHTWREAARW